MPAVPVVRVVTFVSSRRTHRVPAHAHSTEPKKRKLAELFTQIEDDASCHGLPDISAELRTLKARASGACARAVGSGCRAIA